MILAVILMRPFTPSRNIMIKFASSFFFFSFFFFFFSKNLKKKLGRNFGEPSNGSFRDSLGTTRVNPLYFH